MTSTIDSLAPGLSIADAVARGILTDDPPNTLRGRALRFVLVDILRQRDSLTVAELVGALTDQGFRVAGRASKTISDALRWERARGRVVRVRRGLYRYGRPPKSTARRIMIFARRCRDWLVAQTRTQPPTPIRSPIRPIPTDPPGPPPPGQPGAVPIGTLNPFPPTRSGPARPDTATADTAATPATRSNAGQHGGAHPPAPWDDFSWLWAA